MKVLQIGTMPNGTPIQIEEWQENYSFISYGSTIASYPKSKMSHEGSFAPKGGEIYRFHFNFPTTEEAQQAFNSLSNGVTVLADYVEYMHDRPKYADCI